MIYSIIAFGLLFTTLLVGVFFAYLFRLKRQPYLLYWAGGWAVYALHYIPPALSLWFDFNPISDALTHLFFGAAGILFFLGTQLYTRKKLWVVPAILVAIFIALWSAANALLLFSLSSCIPGGLVYLGVAYLFLRESQHHET